MAEKHYLNVLSLGLALGIVCAIIAFLFGMAAWLFGFGRELLELVSFLYIGYGDTFLGTIIGTVGAFVDGFIVGVVIAWLYNRFQKMKK